ncbi:MAG: LuxR C-terminal-related transcriptional regulator, partial [Anaerolineae bacterium]|nr:LuxR C-terminal-related transcriptional regulator [Anaerolineae bacterium]
IRIREVMQGETVLSQKMMSPVISNYRKLAIEQAHQIAQLSCDDLEILNAMANGATNKDIAEQFFWSEATVKRKIQEIIEKLDTSNRVQAIAEAIRRGWI